MKENTVDSKQPGVQKQEGTHISLFCVEIT